MALQQYMDSCTGNATGNMAPENKKLTLSYIILHRCSAFLLTLYLINYNPLEGAVQSPTFSADLLEDIQKRSEGTRMSRCPSGPAADTTWPNVDSRKLFSDRPCVVCHISKNIYIYIYDRIG